MLTRNFYKLLAVDRIGTYIRLNSPNAGASSNAPFIDIINANGKIICTSSVNSTDESKYEKVNGITGNLVVSNSLSSYTLGCTNSTSSSTTQGEVTKKSYTKSINHPVSSWVKSKDINDDVSFTGYPEGSGCIIMYLGNGTTEPTKDDYTMESCITNYDILNCSSTEIYDAGLSMISLTIKPLEDLQLSEIGVFSTPASGSNSSTVKPKSYSVMVCHDVFTPVTLPKDKVVTINYTINLSELTAETTIG